MIVHFDIDAFYASVEVRDDPSLRGKPVAVAGSSRRAVVLTASYEARPFGVRSAMPLYRARSACPELVVVPPHHDHYRAVSRDVFAIFSEGAKAVEGLSLDEAFVDIGSHDATEVVAFAERVRSRVRGEIGVTVSAGVAKGKMVAKIASDSCKPDGLAVVAPGTEAEYLAPQPVGRLWGVGPKAQHRLAAAGVTTIGEFAALDDTRLFALFGRSGKALRELACGNDERTVSGDRETVSVSTEETFEYDIREHAKLLDVLREQSVDVAERLLRHGVRGATVGVKLKGADFKITSRQTHLAEPTDDPATIFAAAEQCLQRAHIEGVAVRLIGIRIGDLTEDTARQLSLLSRLPGT
jgi:DNA polymerase IV